MLLEQVKKENKEMIQYDLDISEKLNLLSQNMTECVWLFDFSNMTYKYMSPSITNLRGFTIEEAKKEHPYDAFTPESRANINEFVVAQMANPSKILEQSKKGTSLVVQQYCKDGSIKDIEIRLTLIPNMETNFVDVLGVSKDVTQMKQQDIKYKAIIEEKDLEIQKLKNQLSKMKLHTIVDCDNSHERAVKEEIDSTFAQEQHELIQMEKRLNKELQQKNEIIRRLDQSEKELGLVTKQLLNQNGLLEAAAKASELAFLNAQIKPHFLYNTLNIIVSYCEIDASKARDLIISLSKYLRGILDFDNLESKASLKRELELIDAYVTLEKARFQGLDVCYNIDVDMDILIPTIILQPLVENAIIHGIYKNVAKGTVWIEAVEVGDKIKLTVKDNGIGMTKEQIDGIFERPASNGSIGLYNVNSRLLKTYGSGLTIESQLDKGTEISMILPKK